jgi:putative transposase
MIDEDRVACAPSTVYRVLKGAGLLQAWEVKASSQGQGFEQPTAAPEHWHIDIAYLNLGGTFYYLGSVLDGYSRVIVHWALEETMTTVGVVLQAARERVPGARRRSSRSAEDQLLDRGRMPGSNNTRQLRGRGDLFPLTVGRQNPWHPTQNGRPKFRFPLNQHIATFGFYTNFIVQQREGQEVTVLREFFNTAP